MTDASEKYWSGVVTQVHRSELHKEINQQAHLPLAFVGQAFSASQQRWSTPEKEAYAIYQVFRKLDYFFMGENPIHVYTDHRNLMFAFNPQAFEPTLGRHVITKVQRWELYLSQFDYTIEHILGKLNIFADMLTRWTKSYQTRQTPMGSVHSLVMRAKPIVLTPKDFVWPTVDTVRESQARAGIEAKHCTNQTWNNTTNTWMVGNAFLIAETDKELLLKFMVVAHCGVGGHRGVDATISVLREQVFWKTQRRDVMYFIKGCIHCIVSRTGMRIPRLFGSTIHATRPNEVLHCDFLFMGESTTHQKYILIIRDDLSSYVWLWPCIKADSTAVAEALSMWIASFGGWDWLVTDQGAHFKNQLLHRLSEEFHYSHYFTTPYCPWNNGSVERVCREVLRACKALLSEWKIKQKEWPRVAESVQSVLNHAPLKRLGVRSSAEPLVHRTPLEVFTGHVPVRPLMRAWPVEQFAHATCQDETRMRQLIGINELQKSLHDMHKNVESTVTKNWTRSVERHNNKTNVRRSEIEVGGFVLVREAQSRRTHKSQFMCKGPRRVVSTKSEWVFEVEDIINQKKQLVHVPRMILYRADLDGKEVDPALLEYARTNETEVQTADSLCDIRDGPNGIELLVQWQGLPGEVDRTWEPLGNVAEDIPGVLQDFLYTTKKRDLKQRAMRHCFTEETN